MKFTKGAKYIYIGPQELQDGWNKEMTYVFGYKVLECVDFHKDSKYHATLKIADNKKPSEHENNLWNWGREFQKNFIQLTGTRPSEGSGYFQRGAEFHLGFNPGEKRDLVVPGIYELNFTGGLTPQPYLLTLDDDEVDFTETENYKHLVSIMDNFFDNKDKYKQIGVSHHEGVILDGPPGTGKTTLASAASKHFIKRGGIAIWCKTPDLFQAAVDFIRSNDSDSNILLLIDELDKIRYNDKTLSSFLAGPVPLNGVMTLYTTNSTLRLSDSLIRRPGRIRHRIRVDEVDAEAYKTIIRKKLPSITDEVLNIIVKDYKGMPIDGVIQILVNHIVYKMSLKKSLQNVVQFYKDSHKQNSNVSWNPGDVNTQEFLQDVLAKGLEKIEEENEEQPEDEDED
jgi:DNA replication protein DnaC